MISLSEFGEALRQVVASEPDYVYDSGMEDGESCTYLPNIFNPGTGCGLGEACVLLGVPREALAELDGEARKQHDTAWNSDAAAEFLGRYLAPEVLESAWLYEFQAQQDDGKPWGEALQKADQKAAEKGWPTG